MSTKFPEIWQALAAEFDPSEVKSRKQGGRDLHYITARTAMNRLDAVLGPENWEDEYIPGAESVMCRLAITLPDGSRLTKCDAGGYAGMADSGDDDKSGFSDAFKRAAVKFGVGRYLYQDGVPRFAANDYAGWLGRCAGKANEQFAKDHPGRGPVLRPVEIHEHLRGWSAAWLYGDPERVFLRPKTDPIRLAMNDEMAAFVGDTLALAARGAEV
jgi:hypothetical protein